MIIILSNRKIAAWQIAGFIFTVIVGTLLHFTYEWSGNLQAVGLFSAVNESVWEHFKMLIVPTVVFTLIEFFAYGRKLPCFLPVRFWSLIIGILLIAAGFYTYTGAVGKEILAVDIILFLAAAYVVYRRSYKKLIEDSICSAASVFLAVLGFAVIIALIIMFTLNAPELPLFRDPASGTYGIK